MWFYYENIISLYPHMQVTVTFSHFLRLVMNSFSSFGYFWYIEAYDNKTGQLMHIRFTIFLKSFIFNKFRKRYKNWMFRWGMWPMGLCLLLWCKIFEKKNANYLILTQQILNQSFCKVVRSDKAKSQIAALNFLFSSWNLLVFFP